MARRFEAVLDRGYALVVFNPNDCAEDTTLRNADGSWAFRTARFYPAYPGYDWGILAGWAWGRHALWGKTLVAGFIVSPTRRNWTQRWRL